MENREFKKRDGRIWAGLFLLVVGGLLLVQKMGGFFPSWLFTWPMLLIVFGIFAGLKNRFRWGGWIFLILLGGIFLTDTIYPAYALKNYLIPIAIIYAGIAMIVMPRRNRRCRNEWKQHWQQHMNSSDTSTTKTRNPPTQNSFTTGTASAEDPGEFIDSTAVFGGVRKIILSKNSVT